MNSIRSIHANKKLLGVVLLLVLGVVSVASAVTLNARDIQVSQRKAMEDELPILTKGSYYDGQLVELTDVAVSKQAAISAAINHFLAENPILLEIPQASVLLEKENRATTAIMTGSYLDSNDDWIPYSDRPTWIVELSSIPYGGGSCGPLMENDCPPPGRAPFYKVFVDAQTGEVFTARYQGLGPPDPVWSGVRVKMRQIQSEMPTQERPSPTAVPAN